METRMLLFVGLFLAVLTHAASAVAQSSTKDEVELTVNGDGKTTEEATKEALRSAISQAYGVFVSANTTLLNDELLVKDEIVTLTNGNIKKYEEVANVTLPNGNKSVTLKATVCISKLVSYAESKGATVEFAGATFAMNMKMKELNKKNELKTLRHLEELVALMLPSCYELKCEIGDVQVSEKHLMPDKAKETYDIPIIVSFIPNEKAAELQNTIVNTLNNISLSYEEVQEYIKLNLGYYYLGKGEANDCYDFPNYGVDKRLDRLYFRNDREVVSCELMTIMMLSLNEMFNFVISDNNGNLISFSLPSTFLSESLDLVLHDHPEGSYNGRIPLLLTKKLQNRCKEVLPFTVFFDWRSYSYDDDWTMVCPWASFNIEYAKDGLYIALCGLNFPKEASLKIFMQIPQSDISKYSNFKVVRSFDSSTINFND